MKVYEKKISLNVVFCFISISIIAMFFIHIYITVLNYEDCGQSSLDYRMFGTS